MLKRNVLLMLLVAVLTVTGAYAQYAPILWDTAGVNLRQGYHTQWDRAGDYDTVTGDQVYVWSDCRLGFRNVYAQKIDINGDPQWDANGKLIIAEAGRQQDPQVMYSGDGNWIVVWVDFRNAPESLDEGDLYAQKVDTDGDPLWDPTGVPVCVWEDDQVNQKLVDDGEGGVIITWEDNRNDSNDLYAQHLTSSGELALGWSVEGLPVIVHSYRQEDFSAGTDGQGGAIVAWEDFRTSGNVDIYAQRIHSDGTLAWITSGAPICTVQYEQRDPELCTDYHGGAFIVWKDMRNDHNFGDLYFQRVDALGNAAFEADGRVLCDATLEQVDCEIVASDDAGAIFAWTDFRNDPQCFLSDIYAQRVDAVGNAIWGTNGMVVCDATQAQMYPWLISDSANGAIIVWEDVRNGGDWYDAEIYAQRISASGTPMWTANGMVITDAPERQYSPMLIPDLNHGALIVWGKQAYYSTYGVQSLFLQHVNGEGEIQLPENGVEFQTGIDGDVDQIRMVETVPGRALVLWKDSRYSGFAHLCIQLIDQDGNAYLEQNGRALCESSLQAYMESPQMVPDLMHGALVAWEDWRNAGLLHQIYAQRIDENGNILWTECGVPVYPSQDQQYGPYIAPTGDGGAFVLWSGTVGSDIYVFAQKLDANGAQVWTDPIQVSNGIYEDICYGAVPDGLGGVITTWHGGPWPYVRAYAQKLDSDGQPQWRPFGLLVCPADSGQWIPSLISDGRGGAYVAWGQDTYPLYQEDVVAQHVDRSGNLLWSDSGLVVCDAQQDQYSTTMELDNEGNVFFLWGDFRSGQNVDVYLQIVTAVGEILCEPNGFPVSVGEYDRWSPVMVSDSQDGVYLEWEVYGYSGGEFESDIYGLHVNGDCEIVSGWTENGEIVNDELFHQQYPAIVSDGNGGAIVAWEDGRCTSGEEISYYNLFAQRVNDFTTSVGRESADPVPLTFSLEQNYPNPFNPDTRIRYSIPEAGSVRIAIFDILGRRVRVLENRMMPAGSHEVVWNGKTASGTYASSGIYFYRLQAGNRSEVRKMVLLK